MKASALTQTPDRSAPKTARRSGVLQRCACGGKKGPSGECAECRRKRLQPKLRIGAADDRFEREADRVADAVMAAPADAAPLVAPLSVQRTGTGGGGMEAPASVDAVIASPGRPLEGGTRQFMEARIGHDFSGVRVHTDARAAASAREVGARAYTVGRDLAFGTGEYRPGTTVGRRLLAHELTHVAQQRAAAPALQRWSFGSGAPPHADYQVIPADQQDRVRKGMALVKRAVDNPKDYPACHKHFETHCSGGSPTSLASKFNAATLWFDTDDTVWGSGVNPDHVAYSSATYRLGRWFIGSVMIHEMMHRCGQDDEAIDDEAIKKCGFRDVALSGGKVVEK